MKVSISLITYNHEKYIRQSVESILMQEVNFDYEIVIGEDCSTDHTRDILLELQSKHPDKIRLLLPEKNLGMVKNFATLIEASQGQYIAMLDGDDYWTSPHKLQKQVDFLDSHPECAICFHNMSAFYEDKSQAPYLLCAANQKEFSTLEDIFKFDFMPSSGVMFRRGLVGDLPEWYYGLKIEDWPLHILNALHGKMGYINEVMGAYRIHHKSAWSSKGALHHLHAHLEMFEHLKQHLGPKYEHLSRAGISKNYLDLAAVHADRGQMAQAKGALHKSITEYPFYLRIRWKDFVVMMGRVHLPPLYKFMKSTCQRR
jgi:glycosyltransferase involved in cell wall biosynthesis